MNIVQELPILIPRLCEGVYGDGSNANNQSMLSDEMKTLRLYYESDTPDEDRYSSRPKLRAAYIYHYMVSLLFVNRIRDVKAFLRHIFKYLPLA